MSSRAVLRGALGYDSVEQQQSFLAGHFHRHMTEGGSFGEVNKYPFPFEVDFLSSLWKWLQALISGLIPYFMLPLVSYPTSYILLGSISW